MRLVSFLFLSTLIFSQPLWATSYCASTLAQKCVPKDAMQELAINQCKIAKTDAACEKLYQENPDVKQRNCEEVVHCPTFNKISDYATACVAGAMNNWKDIAEFLFNDGKMSPDLSKREEYFRNCTTAECKREMLGPYVGLFSKEEIEGAPFDQKFFDPNDPVSGNNTKGLGAKTLYHELLKKLRKKLENKTLDEPYIEPWSAKEAKIEKAKSFNEMIDGALEKAGFHNTACYAPEVLAEMRCYALMTLADPFVALKAPAMISKIAGLTGKAAKSVPRSMEDLNRIKIAAQAKASKIATDLKNLGSNSVYHRQKGLHNHPEVIKKIDEANNVVIHTSFDKNIANVQDLENLNWKDYTGNFVKNDTLQKLSTDFKTLDPEIQNSIHGVLNKMNDKHAYMNYMENFSTDVVGEIERAAIPRELEALKKGTLSENAALRVLARRAQSRGQSNMSNLVPNEIGELTSPSQIRNTRSEVTRGPQFNLPFKNEQHNLTHVLQEDYVADVVSQTTRGQSQKFWNFLDSKEGGNYWVPLFDSNNRRSLTRPEFTRKMTNRYLKLK